MSVSARKIFLDIVGPLQTNCWILKTGLNFLIVDPGDSGARIADWVLKNKAPDSQADVFLIHGHVDHTFGVPDVCSRLKSARIFACRKDLDFFNSPELNRSQAAKQSTSLKDLNDRMVFVDDGDILSVGDDKLKVLGLPGHTPGCLGLYHPDEKCVFVGDTLFKGAIGAANGPRADLWEIIRSIKRRLLPLPDETLVLPGHGPVTTIGDEKRENPFLTGDV